MVPATCEICSKEFSRTEYIPKVLPCGHTFCHVCINVILVTDKNCLTCKTPFSQRTDELPTNFMVLSLSESQDKPPALKDGPSQMESTLKSLEKDLLERKEMLLKHIEEKTSFKNLINAEITNLEQMLEMDPENRNSEEVEKLIVDLEDYLKKADAILYFGKNPEIKPTYSLNEYLNPSCFLSDLCNRLHKNEKIFAYKMVQNSQLKYGKIVLLKDRVCIHSLTLTEVERPSSVVSFEDVKKCITPEKEEKFRAFIEIGDQMLSFSITDSSFLASQFVKLCSGENGPTFKGVVIQSLSFKGVRKTLLGLQNYFSGSTMHVKQYTLNDEETVDFSDYDLTIFCSGKETKCSKDSIVVQMNPGGTCEIRKCENEAVLKNIVAIVNESNFVTWYPTFEKEKSKVIENCGISFLF